MLFLVDKNWLLVTIGTGVFLLAAWMSVEAVIAFVKRKNKDLA